MTGDVSINDGRKTYRIVRASETAGLILLENRSSSESGVFVMILTVANQKGCRITTAVNLAASLAVAERRELLVDFDPQGNASSAFGLMRRFGDPQVYHALMGEIPANDAILSTDLPGLHLLPAGQDLIGAEVELVHAPSRHDRLRALLDPLRVIMMISLSTHLQVSPTHAQRPHRVR